MMEENLSPHFDQGYQVGNDVYTYIRDYISADTDMHMLLTLWCLHTWVYQQLYTTPRLLITSILPASGKSTVLEWFDHLCSSPVSMSAVSSAAMLARLADRHPTILIDEADRALRKDNPLTADFLAITNSGYKRGSSRPVLVKNKQDWDAQEFSTWSPVAFAGNDPDLPDDTKSRCISVFLYPSDDIKDSDWELIEDDSRFKILCQEIREWAQKVDVTKRPKLDGITGRMREKWLPLARVAQTLGDIVVNGDHINWLDTVRRLAHADKDFVKDNSTLSGAETNQHIIVLRDIKTLWELQWDQQKYVGSQTMCDALAAFNPYEWGRDSASGKAITPKRLGIMLNKSGVHVTRYGTPQIRAYRYESFLQAWSVISDSDTPLDTSSATVDQSPEILQQLKGLQAFGLTVDEKATDEYNQGTLV